MLGGWAGFKNENRVRGVLLRYNRSVTHQTGAVKRVSSFDQETI